MREILQVQGLTKTFRLSAKQQKLERTKEKVRVAVDNLSFSAYEGEIFGLLGPNGAGKTTTLRLLATLIRPDSGDAIVDGVNTQILYRETEQDAFRPVLTTSFKEEMNFLVFNHHTFLFNQIWTF